MNSADTSKNLSPRRKAVAAMQQMIARGVFDADKRLPSECELAQRIGVSRGTLRSAFTDLVDMGLLESRKGFGCNLTEKAAMQCRRARETTLTSAAIPEKSGKKRVTFLVPLNRPRTLFDEILCGVEAVSSSLKYELNLLNLERYLQDTKGLLTLLKEQSSPGVIFSPLTCENYYEVNSRFLDLFESNKIPYVVVDNPIARDGVIRGNFVGSDGYSAMRQVVRELRQLGHRRIASIRVFPGVYTADSRGNGIRDQLTQEALPCADRIYHLTIADTTLEKQGHGALRRLLELPEPPTAIVCTHDTLAMNVIDELRKMKLKTPEDISIFGFDDDYFAEFLKLSTVRQPFREIGRRAMQMLVDLNETARTSGSQPQRQEFLPCQVILRESATAPAEIRKNQSDLVAVAE